MDDPTDHIAQIREKIVPPEKIDEWTKFDPPVVKVEKDTNSEETKYSDITKSEVRPSLSHAKNYCKNAPNSAVLFSEKILVKESVSLILKHIANKVKAQKVTKSIDIAICVDSSKSMQTAVENLSKDFIELHNGLLNILKGTEDSNQEIKVRYALIKFGGYGMVKRVTDFVDSTELQSHLNTLTSRIKNGKEQSMEPGEIWGRAIKYAANDDNLSVVVTM